MAVVWPVSVNTVQYDTLVRTTEDQRIVFKSDVGNSKTSSLSTTEQAVIGFDVIFTGAELSAFWSWWETDLALGSDSFTGLEGIVGDSQREMKFRTVPSFTMLRSAANSANRLWRASFNLWLI